MPALKSLQKRGGETKISIHAHHCTDVAFLNLSVETTSTLSRYGLPLLFVSHYHQDENFGDDEEDDDDYYEDEDDESEDDNNY